MSAELGNGAEAERFLFPRLERAEALTLSHGDVLDVKASIALVVVAFLAEQNITMAASSEPERWLGRIAMLMLATAAVLAVAELWPRDYRIDQPEGWIGWYAEIRDFHKEAPDPAAAVSEAAAAYYSRQLLERIEENRAVNERKQTLLLLTFASTGVAMACSIFVGLMRAWS